MKILIALSYTPYPVRRGTGRLVMNLIRGLAERHEVVLATMTHDMGEARVLREIENENVSVATIVAPNRRSAAHRLFYKARNLVLAAALKVPTEVLYAAPEQFLTLISDTARGENIDLVIAFYWHLYELPGRLVDIDSAIATQDLDYLMHGERVKRAGGPFKRMLAAADARMKAQIEKRAYRRYRTILTVTESDADLLRNSPLGAGKEVHALPLAIDLDMYRPDEFVRDPGTILLLGLFSSDFNRDALLYLLHDVFPLVLKKRPQAVLKVVGQGAEEFKRTEQGKGVEFIGAVDDIRPYLGRCSLMVLPLRFGGGVRIRMMEAAAMGTPVVSTPMGVAGMGLLSGRDYLEAASPDAMADAIIRVLEDRALADEIGRNAREWADRSISMKNYPDRLDTLLRSVVSSSSKSRM